MVASSPMERTILVPSYHESDALIRKGEDPCASQVDVENPHIFFRDELENGQSHGLVSSIVNAMLEPVQCLCSCMLNCNASSSPQKQKDTSARTKSTVKIIKYIYSGALLGFCVNLIIAGIFARETPVAIASHPIVAFCTMWILIIWLGMLEGGQGCLVGLQPIDKESYAVSHPTTHQCALLAHKGDNLNRFIVGRQFLVVLVVFCLNLCCTVVEDAVVPGFPPAIVGAVLESGLAVMLITVILGQLSAEVNATNCMLDFINTPAMYVTTWICLVIEASGLLHSTYLVQNIFALFTTTPTEVPPRTPKESFFYWGRVLFSFSLLSYAMVITAVALYHEQTTMYKGPPVFVSFAFFIFLIFFLGTLEAMQIALFAVVNLPKTALEGYPTAQANCHLSFQGHNFKAFLIGRQICVTTCMFLLARFTTTEVDPSREHTVMGVSAGIQDFFNTGLPGALITTIIASLVWRIIASTFPVQFMNNPLVYLTIRICLLLEKSGVFASAWLLSIILKKLAGFQPDEDYIGPMEKPEEDESSTEGETSDSESSSSDDDSTDEEEGLELESPTHMSANYGATTH